MTLRRFFAAALVVVLGASACTLFDDPPPQGGAGPSGGGGEGGSAPAGCTIDSPRCLLPDVDAVRLCSLVAQCDQLAASVALSTGLPLAVLDAGGAVQELNFSACVDWLTTSLEGAHAGFDSVRAAVNCIAATSTCAAAGACLSFEVIAIDDERCTPAPPIPTCEDDALVDCAGLVVTHCDGLDFTVPSHCESGDAGDVCRVKACDSPGVSCDQSVDTAYEIACTSDGDEVGTNCSAHSLSCTEGVGCSSPSNVAPSCDTPYMQTCAGPSLVGTCTTRTPQGLRESLIDCSKVGLTCVPNAQSAQCGTPNPSCSPYDPTANVCEGGTNVLDLCLAGSPTTFDCSSIGLTCAANDGMGLSGRCALP